MIIKQSNNGKYPLVLLHGWGVNSGVWSLIVDELENHFDVHCIDLPGFGHNAGEVLDNYTLNTVVEVIAPLCPRNSLIVGWSLGGLVASTIALRYPQKVASLCLIASSPCFIEQTGWQGIKAEILSQFSQALNQDTQKTVERFLAIQAMGSESARKDTKLLKQMVFNHPMASIQALEGGLSILQKSDIREQIKHLKIPVKGIYGQRDTLVPTVSITKMAESMVDFEYRILAKASHAPFISHRTAFIRCFNELNLKLALL